jgi:hypothetical protein
MELQGIGITAKTERAIRQSFRPAFWKLETLWKREITKTKHSSNGDEHTGEFREFHFGDGWNEFP